MKLKEKKSAYLFSVCVRGNNLKYTRKQELSLHVMSKAFLKEKGGGGGGAAPLVETIAPPIANFCKATSTAFTPESE